jgi:hypothetical protein
MADFLYRLKRVLEETPENVLATRPIPRGVLAAAVAEIEALRSQVATTAAASQAPQPGATSTASELPETV